MQQKQLVYALLAKRRIKARNLFDIHVFLLQISSNLQY